MIDLNAMYKITTQERLLQAMVYEAEKLQDIRFVLQLPPIQY